MGSSAFAAAIAILAIFLLVDVAAFTHRATPSASWIKRRSCGLSARRGNLGRLLDDADDDGPAVASTSDVRRKASNKVAIKGAATPSKKERRAESALLKKEIDEEVSLAISGLNDCIAVDRGKQRDLVELMRIIEEDLRKLNVNNAKLTAKTTESTDYKLGFAGSDAAICAIGSGLHKVPLANLDEIFISLFSNRCYVREVIRIIGPFPNVLNSLLGDVTVDKNVLTTTYTSIIDGTGKELVNAPNEERKMDYEVVFASDEYLVLYAEKTKKIENLLVFERSVNMDDELMKNRVGATKNNII